MATNLKTSTCNTQLDAITTAIGATGNLWVYSGTAPAKSAGAYVAPTGTLGVKMACSNPFAPGSSAGVLTASTITTTAATASITPGYYRVTTGTTDTDGSTVIMQGTAGVGSGDLNFSSAISSGGNVSISSFTITNASAA